MLTACRPPECQVLNAMLGVSVGLCAEYEVRGGLNSAQMSGSFSAIRYAASTVGLVGSVMSISRAQPHGQPCALPVAVPYTSSETQAQSRPHSLMALWAPGPRHDGRVSLNVIGRGCGFGVPFAKSDVSTMANPPVRSAKKALVPSLLTESECRPPEGFSRGSPPGGGSAWPCMWVSRGS